MRNSKLLLFSVFFLVTGSLFYTSCKSDPPQKPDTSRPKGPVAVPAFDADAAYDDIAKQVSFGPRVMGSEGHDATKEWLVAELKTTGAKVIEQDIQAAVYTGEK